VLLRSVHDFMAKVTPPVPTCDQLTMPVGKNPVTRALQVMLLGEPAGTLLGLQETVVDEVLFVTFRPSDPADGRVRAFPPYFAFRTTGDPAAAGWKSTEQVLKDPCPDSLQVVLEY
jgi:hypothetical protein